MWRVCGKAIFPRWQSARQGAANIQNAKKKDGKKAFAAIPNDEKQSHDEKRKQYAHQQHRRCWDNPQYHFDKFCDNLLTIGWVGATVLCLDLKHRLSICSVFDRNARRCPFSRLVYAMPKSKPTSLNEENKALEFKEDSERFAACQPLQPQCQPSLNKDLTETSILENVDKMMVDSISAMENCIGVILAEQDEKESFRFFKSSARLGCPRGFFNLGLCYEKGHGTNTNLKKAAHCYQIAASKGHSLATYNLAIYTLKGLGGIALDYEKGMELLKEAAKNGVPQAQVCLGIKYLDEKNWHKAYTLFRDASSKDVNGKFYLGLCYENGWGIAQNETVSMELYAQASKAGHEEATLKLGMYYEHGCQGIDADLDFSMTLYKMLADKGHTGGKRAMEELKEKQKPKFKAIKESNTTVDNLKPNSMGSIHTSLSLPELLNYGVGNSLVLSKSTSIEAMYSKKVAIYKQKPPIQAALSENCSLDLAVKSSYSFQHAMPRIVAANS